MPLRGRRCVEQGLQQLGSLFSTRYPILKQFGDAVILCGGKSRRMQFDKAFAKIDDRYIIEIIYEKLSMCFDTVKLCADTKERVRAFGIETIEDKASKGIGPAVGIYSALEQATSRYVFVTACDMPLIDAAHIRAMMQYLANNEHTPDALVPMNGDYIEPLHSFYATSMLPMLEAELADGNYRIHRILDKCDTQYLEDTFSQRFDADLAMFTNINTMEDLARVAKMLPKGED